MFDDYNPKDHEVRLSKFAAGIGIFLVGLSLMIALSPMKLENFGQSGARPAYGDVLAETDLSTSRARQAPVMHND